eukprot:2129829-Pyramimonas_sp.AAC.1
MGQCHSSHEHFRRGGRAFVLWDTHQSPWIRGSGVVGEGPEDWYKRWPCAQGVQGDRGSVV